MNNLDKSRRVDYKYDLCPRCGEPMQPYVACEMIHGCGYKLDCSD